MKFVERHRASSTSTPALAVLFAVLAGYPAQREGSHPPPVTLGSRSWDALNEATARTRRTPTFDVSRDRPKFVTDEATPSLVAGNATQAARAANWPDLKSSPHYTGVVFVRGGFGDQASSHCSALSRPDLHDI